MLRCSWSTLIYKALQSAHQISLSLSLSLMLACSLSLAHTHTLCHTHINWNLVINTSLILKDHIKVGMLQLRTHSVISRSISDDWQAYTAKFTLQNSNLYNFAFCSTRSSTSTKFSPISVFDLILLLSDSEHERTTTFVYILQVLYD